jgi:hypothetical protein
LVVALTALSVLALPGSASAARPDDEGPGVYLLLVDGASVPLEEALQSLEGALGAGDWVVAGRMDPTPGPSECAFRSGVIVAYPRDYAARLMASGQTAAFALPVRFVVWEDENGVSVGATNPMNLNRTIVDEDTSPQDWADVATSIRTVAEAAFPGQTADGEYGQHREKARIGRTMGIMAGGKFEDKVEDVLNIPAPGVTASVMAKALMQKIPTLPGEWDWALTPVYLIDLPESGVALVGVSGRPLERDAFSIVGSGGNEAREDMACPGIDHAAAFPIEILVAKDGDRIRIAVVDEMYRMKMFFEDAGKMAFAKNMAMPGSIENELKDKIKASFR